MLINSVISKKFRQFKQKTNSPAFTSNQYSTAHCIRASPATRYSTYKASSDWPTCICGSILSQSHIVKQRIAAMEDTFLKSNNLSDKHNSKL